MSKFKSQFYQIIEKTEDSVFTKPAFELFNKKNKSNYKFKYYGLKEGESYYRVDVKVQDDFKLVFSKAFIEVRVDEQNHTAIFEMVWLLTGMHMDSAIIGKVIEEEGKLKYVPFDDKDFEQTDTAYPKDGGAVEIPGTGLAIKL
jgi:hypothetical protein